MVSENEEEEEICAKIKQWMMDKSQFTQQEAEREFSDTKKREQLFRKVLAKLDDEGIIGNMGDYYQYLD